jgi:hypothetical protein
MVMRTAFKAVASLRGDRVFHPHGVALTGVLRLGAEQGAAARSALAQLPRGTGDLPVVARMSKGVGLPGALPDALGLALRIPLVAPVDTSSESVAVTVTGGLGNPAWDVLLISSADSMPGKFLPLPARSWDGAHFGTLMAYRDGGSTLFWLHARVEGADGRIEASTAALAELITDAGLVLGLYASGIRGGLARIGEVRLRRVLSVEAEPQPTFDPVRNCPPGVELAPRWLAGMRTNAYQGSRRERGVRW